MPQVNEVSWLWSFFTFILVIFMVCITLSFFSSMKFMMRFNSLPSAAFCVLV